MSKVIPLKYTASPPGRKMAGAMKTQEGGRLSLSGITTSATRAYLLSCFSALIYSIVTLLIKHIDNISPAQLMAYRYWATLSLNFPLLVLTGKNVFGPPGFRIAIFFRSLAIDTAVLLNFFAFRFLPLGEAAVLISTYPAFITFAARIFLKESFGLLHIISLLTTVIGVILTTGVCETITEISRIYTTENIYGVTAALVSVAFVTTQVLLTRKLKHVHHSVLLFNSSIVAIVESVIVTATVGGFHLHYRGWQQVFIILIGVLSYAGLATLIVAQQSAEAGPVMTIRAASDILFSFIWQVVLFGETPNVVKIFGAVLICISIVLVGFSKRIKAFLPERCSTL